jgi:hypothetical protein
VAGFRVDQRDRVAVRLHHDGGLAGAGAG